MATYNKIHSFVENIANQSINLGGGGLKVALTNTPHVSSWDGLDDLTQVGYFYCSSRTLVTTSAEQTDGTFNLLLEDLTLTASGGSVGPFQYVYVYDDNSTGDKLICYFDRGIETTLADGDKLTLNMDKINGLLTIT